MITQKNINHKESQRISCAQRNIDHQCKQNSLQLSNQQTIHSEKQNSQLKINQHEKRFDQSSSNLNLKQSPQSVFYTPHFQVFQSIKHQSLTVQQPESLKIQIWSYQEKNQQYSYMSDKGSENSQNQEIINEKMFKKNPQHKTSEQIFQCQQLDQKPSSQNEKNPGDFDDKNKLKQCQNSSSLHRIIDQNHLQDKNQNQFQVVQNNNQNSKKISKKNIENNENNENHMEKKIQSPEKALSQNIRLQKITLQNKKKEQTKNEKDSPIIKPPGQKKKKNELQFRKIPSQLFQSYDQLNLTAIKGAKKRKQQKQDNINIPLKIKNKTNNNIQSKPKQQTLKPEQKRKQSTSSYGSMDVHFDQQLFITLPIIEGYCEIKSDNHIPIQTKFIIFKNFIAFQASKKYLINHITKIKFIEKEENQIFIKICATNQIDQTKQDVFIINLLTENKENYFQSSYQVFAQIILRKLLLMNINIHELQQKKQVISPKRLPVNPSNNSPNFKGNSMLKSSTKVSIQQAETQRNQYECQLYKRSGFFNNWQKKYFVFNQSQKLQMYTSLSARQQKSKPSLQMTKSPQIWTRFELIYGYLTVKMWLNKIQKIQIGVPLCDFTNLKSNKNWIYAFAENLIWKNHSFSQSQKN